MNEIPSTVHAELRPNVTAVLLAGGSSRRMGFDKGLWSVGGRPLLQLLAARLAEVTDEVLLSANDPAAYGSVGLTIIPDIFPRCGPLAGVHAAMLHSWRPWILALACDLPRISSAMLKNLIRHTRGFHAVVPLTSDGRLHPVCAAYRRDCLPAIERLLCRGENRMTRLLEEPGLRVKFLTATEGGFSDADLRDIDNPQDLEEFNQLLKS